MTSFFRSLMASPVDGAILLHANFRPVVDYSSLWCCSESGHRRGEAPVRPDGTQSVATSFTFRSKRLLLNWGVSGVWEGAVTNRV